METCSQITARAISHHLLRTVTVYPDCLPIEDTIDHISVDENNPEIVRIGGSSGSIALVGVVLLSLWSRH